MSFVGNWWGYAIAALIAVPYVVLTVEALAALMPARVRRVSGNRLRVAILVPAHNEEAHIERTLKQIQSQMRNGDRLVVIADNCGDRTGVVGRATGAEVLERNDLERRGKGYALDFGLTHLAAAPPDVVIIIDADTRVLPGCVDALASAVAASGRPIQGLNLLDAPKDSGPGASISSFAFYFKNAVRPQGLSRLGWPCLLYGTGMALPWSCISKIDLAHGDITEDIRLGIELARLGYPVEFCPLAEVRGDLPTMRDSSHTQRKRWEHGHIRTICREVPRLLIAGILQGRLSLLALALHLGVPPIAFLLLIGLGTGLTLLALGQSGPTIILSLAILTTVIAIGLTWWKFGRDRLPVRHVLFLPFYVIGKVPLYLQYFVRPQREWVRTKRQETITSGAVIDIQEVSKTQ